MSTEKFGLILTIVDKGYSETVISVSRKAGASGGTILDGRGTGDIETENFLGITIRPEKELVLTVVKEGIKKDVMSAIAEELNLNVAGKGFCFSVPINNIAGVAHLISPIKKEDE